MKNADLNLTTGRKYMSTRLFNNSLQDFPNIEMPTAEIKRVNARRISFQEAKPYLAVISAIILSSGVWFSLTNLNSDARIAFIVFGLAVIGCTLTKINDTYIALSAAIVNSISGVVAPQKFFTSLGDSMIWLMPALYRHLFQGIFLIIIILTCSIVSFAQIEPTENFQNLKYFSNAKSNNSIFTQPDIHIENAGKFEKSEKNERKEKKAYTRTNMEKKAFDLMNQKRAEIGLPAVVWNEKIADIARGHSQSMASNKYLSHQGLDGLWVFDRANKNGLKKWKAISENIAFIRGNDDPAAYVVERWLKSTSHRNNALNKRWEESGIGVAIAADGKTLYFTQVFMEKR